MSSGLHPSNYISIVIPHEIAIATLESALQADKDQTRLRWNIQKLAKLKEEQEKISYSCICCQVVSSFKSHFVVAEFALHLQLKGEICVAVELEHSLVVWI